MRIILTGTLFVAACVTADPDPDLGSTRQDLDPLVSLTVLAPMNGNTLYYDRLAPASAGGLAQARISIYMNLENDRPTPLTVGQIRFNNSLLVNGFTVPANTTQPLGIDCTGCNYPTLVLDENQLGANAMINVYDGSNTLVAQRIMTLAPYTNDQGPLPWMGKTRDLAPNEAWSATSAHANNVGGTQSFALDVGVSGWDTISKQYQTFYGSTKPPLTAPGTRWRVYGKPMYALATGTVCFAVNDQPERANQNDNSQPPSGDGTWYPGGNQIFIKTANEITVFAHLQPGSIPPELLMPGTQVTKGQYLGKAGYSGATGWPAPHIHIKTIPANGAPLPGTYMNNCDGGATPALFRPMGFGSAESVTVSEANTRGASGLAPIWNVMNNQTAPDPYGLIYPATSGFSFCGSCTDVAEHIAVVRPGSSIDLRAKATGFSAFVAKRNEMSADGFRLSQLETFKENNQQQFIGIFTRATSAADAADANDLQDFTDIALFKQAVGSMSTSGRHLVDLATFVDSSSVRHFIAVFRAGGNGYQAVVSVPSAQFGTNWTNLSNVNYRLMELETYPLSNGDRQYIGVFEPGTDNYAMWGGAGWTNFWNEVNTLDGQGLRLVDVDSFPSGSSRIYIGVFRQGTDGLTPLRIGGYDNYVQLMEGEQALGHRSVDLHVEHD